MQVLAVQQWGTIKRVTALFAFSQTFVGVEGLTHHAD
jgi:hypothetical protein